MDRSYPVTSHYQINRSATQSIHLCLPIVGERIKKNTCNISKGDLHIHVMVSYPVIKLIVYLQFFNRYYSQLRITKSHSEKKMNSRNTIWKTIHFYSKFWLNIGLINLILIGQPFFIFFGGKLYFSQLLEKPSMKI